MGDTGSRCQKAEGGNGDGEREINGMRMLITSTVVPQLLVEGIVEQRIDETAAWRERTWLRCALSLWSLRR